MLQREQHEFVHTNFVYTNNAAALGHFRRLSDTQITCDFTMDNPTNTPHKAPAADKQPDSLKDIRVLNDPDLTFGLPKKLFWGGIAITLAFTYMLPWYIGLMFGMVYFATAYAIHKDDPHALPMWTRALRRGTHWSAGVYRVRRVKYFNVQE
jgi:type IV secretory pathway TrbD component